MGGSTYVPVFQCLDSEDDDENVDADESGGRVEDQCGAARILFTFPLPGPRT